MSDQEEKTVVMLLSAVAASFGLDKKELIGIVDKATTMPVKLPAGGEITGTWLSENDEKFYDTVKQTQDYSPEAQEFARKAMQPVRNTNIAEEINRNYLYLFRVGQDMRQAQQNYFNTKSSLAMHQAKSQEQEFDRLLEKLEYLLNS